MVVVVLALMVMIKAAMAVVVLVDVVAGALVFLLTSKPRTRNTNNTPTPLAHFPLHRPNGVHGACCLCFLGKEASHIYFGRSWLCFWRDPGVTQGEGEVPHELVIPLDLERATI